MIKIVMTLITALLLSVTTFASTPKMLVVYFSRAGENWQVGNVERGNTAIMGDYIVDLTHADVFEIEPVVPYPVDYYETINVAREESENNARPEFKGGVQNLEQYDIVFIGSPIWNSAPPMIMRTFYEKYPSLGVKTLIPFGTHGGSGISSCERVMKEYFPNATYLTSCGISGDQIRDTSPKDRVEKWLNDIGILPLTDDAQIPDAVDLGLSVKWASWNVGASRPSDFGNYYGWGDTSGQNHSEILDEYPSANPPASICGTGYDIATANLGNEWRMPTQNEFKELAENCNWEWTNLDGVNGMRITGNNGNSIFLPAAGSRTGDKISNQAGQRGNYWSGTLWADNNNFASYLYFYSNADYVQPERSNRRYVGMSVRPVYDENAAGISNIVRNGDLMVSANGLEVTISGFDGHGTVSVFDMLGRCVYSGREPNFTLPNKGIYIISVNNTSMKVAI